MNGTLSLWRKNAKQEYEELESQDTPAKEESYILLKTMSHASVWLNIILQSIISEAVALTDIDTELEPLNHLLRTCIAQHRHLLTRHLTMIELLLKTIEVAKSCNNLSQLNVMHQALLDATKTINAKYAEEATVLQLKGMDVIMHNWLQEKGLQLATTRVLIVGTNGPREELIEKQYFQYLYKQNGIQDAEHLSRHIYYIEMLPEHLGNQDKRALIYKFLATQKMNRQIGVDMLGDPNAMYKDVLGSYAPAVLNAMPARGVCPYSDSSRT